MRFILFILLTLFVFNVAGQRRKSRDILAEPTSKELLLAELVDECFNTNKYNRLQRLKLYPFNKASSIKLISFGVGNLIPVKKQDIDYSKVKESTVLTSDQTDELTAILYNIGFNPEIITDLRIEDLYKCYEPRNGILFLNKEGKAFEFIEICFDCHRTRPSSKKVMQGEFCNQKFSLLKDFFQSASIKYGTLEKMALTYQEIFKLSDTVEILNATRYKLTSKLINDEIPTGLSDTEQRLLFLFNAENVYSDNIINSGFAGFYYNYSGGFYQQTLAALAEIGANRTLAAFKSSIFQWPEKNIPKSRAARREKLLEIVDKAVPEWQALESGLYAHETSESAEIQTREDDLNQLIFKHLISHKDSLKD